MTDVISPATIRVRHFAKGRVVEGDDVQHVSRDLARRFVTPRLNFDELVWPRNERQPAFGLPMSEILDFLVETGNALDLDRNEHLQEALDMSAQVNVLGKEALEGHYRRLGDLFDRDLMTAELDQGLGGTFDTWKVVEQFRGRRHSVLACPARMIHVLAGNSPGVGVVSIIRSALTRGVSLLKLPSNEPVSTTAVLATMAGIDAGHPVTRSFSAAYWQGGDDAVESVLYRPQFFDKVVAWGGQAGIRNVQRHLGPGLELVSMDPKTSISLIGREALEDDQTRRRVAQLACVDVGAQVGCSNSRVQFVEGTVPQVDDYCAALWDALARQPSTAGGTITPSAVRDEVEVLRQMEPLYRAWGGYDGRGLVLRSDEPVDLDLEARTVNVVPVTSLAEAARYVTVATQTVGVYPAGRRAELRDVLAAAGVQRIVDLGTASTGSFGRPHDGMRVLDRLVRWVVDIDQGQAS
jgi:hypothetical protein